MLRKCLTLVSLSVFVQGIGSQVAVADTVIWDIDSSQSFIRLNIPDQDVVVQEGNPGVPAGIRDYSANPLVPAPAWTDDGGRRSFVQGTIATEFVDGVSLTFLDGQHDASAIEFGSFRPDPDAWNEDTNSYDPNDGAPAAFGGQLTLGPGVVYAGDLGIRNILYDLVGEVNLTPVSGGWETSDPFEVGLLSGATLDATTVFGDFPNEELADAFSEVNSGSLIIEDLGNNVRRITMIIDIPVALDLNELELTASIEGQVVATTTITETASVEEALVNHGGYSGQGSPVDSGKSLAKEGQGPQELTYDNLINTSRGINGVVFDISNLGDAGSLSADDFEFQVSPEGAFDQGANPPSGWEAAPAPSSVSVTAGSPDRVLIEWPDNSIMNRWLRITILANENTGLAEPEVYYLGHLLGETTGPTDSTYTVSFGDISPIRSASGQTVDSSSEVDIDKNGIVSFADISAMRPNVGAQLTNITIP